MGIIWLGQIGNPHNGMAFIFINMSGIFLSGVALGFCLDMLW